MEYHSDRFIDHSVMFHDDGRLIALMPASINGDTVTSHGGLTYGGIVSGMEMRASQMLHIFDELLKFLRSHGVKKIVYKTVPYFLHQAPAQEDLYALFRFDAILSRREASSILFSSNRPKISENKRRCIKKAVKHGLTVKQTDDFDTFFKIGEKVLFNRHNLKPVHTAREMRLLAQRFPDNIKLYASYIGDTMLAGVIAFIFPTCVHFQYTFNDDAGLEMGALDIIIENLINSVYPSSTFISFGVSTEDGGRHLNEGLIHQKEMFGARTVVHDFYEIKLF
ncbi:MAG: GNAT family N-acetyltransferase [Geobacteraceae bacterium]|nr:GNAT family N-acetyltransferase [Geobacteraceae bacterium]